MHKDGENVVVEAKSEEIGRAPLHLLGSIVCFGHVAVSPQMMHAASTKGISITFLGWSGRFLARVEGPQTGNILLRRAQHHRTSNDAISVARAIVAAKIANQRAVIRRAIRDHGDPMRDLKASENRLTAIIRRTQAASNMDVLRGMEGDSASIYFSIFNRFIRSSGFSFKKRSRRPPVDPVNAVLSFLYVLLTSDCRAALENIGLDPQMGFLHSDRPGRPSLALDLVEEFRAPLADRVCLTLINRQQLTLRDFKFEETGGVFLTEQARKTVLTSWQQRKRNVLTHPFLSEKMPLGLFPYVQAQLLAKFLRDDLDGYPAYIWK